ncbi:uncharacterized protein LOC117327343 [Pecten maximus]|uniref:uncharacterized protein LOC117327343 n=1 Tax=Pecten maximus TaxID=6579 RepID=UPI0014580E27|nr:uncharacterized protein LOC117327343 [Pecten maximus]XP_033740171.1 uncharacterized protein LOC117327343 [Pecten maximus]
MVTMRHQHLSQLNTLLGKRKNRNVAITQQEVLLLLRTYQSHPCAWGEIIEEIQGNTSTLPLPAQQLYRESTIKQLRERLSTKLSKLFKDGSEDATIRLELGKIRAL